MSSKVDERYYIACRDIPLQRGTWKELKDRVWSSQSPEHLLKGELLVIEGDGTRDVVRGRMALDRSKKFECSTDDVAYVTSVEYRILAPIKSPGERWDLFKDKQIMDKLKDLRVDEHIWITLPMGKDPKSGLIGSSTLRGTIRYIGGIHQEIGTYFGIELPVPKGTCDGSFKEGRYFLCSNNHGVFLPASHLNLTKSKQASSKVARGEVVLPLVKSKSGQEFCKDDKVFVFDKNGKRISGKVKWAYHRHNIEDHIIGIETDSSNTSFRKFPDHVRDCRHLFKEHDHKRHSYLALPETVVGKVEPEGSSVDCPTQSYNEWELLHNIPADEQIMSKSLQNTVSQIAMQHAVSTEALLDKQSKVMEEGQKKKEQEVAKELGLSTLEFKEHKEAMKKFEQKQEEIDHNRPLYQNSTTQQGEKIAIPGTSIHERSDESSEYRRKSEEDILQRHNVTNVGREALKRQQSEGHYPQLPRKSRLVYSFSVGSLVEVPVGEKIMYGTVRWMGTFPKVQEPIAGVELDECHPDCGDGSWTDTEYFKCRNGHGMFIAMSKLRPDSRYPTHVERGRNPSIPGTNSADSEMKDLVQELRHEYKDLLHQHKQLQEDQQNLKLGQEELEIENQQIKEDYQQLIAEHRQLQEANDGIQATLDQTTTRLEQTTAGLEQTTATLQTAMQKITQLEKTVLDMQPSWSIHPTELQMTDERIGGGGWGVVKAGLYHGTKVAVKEIYDIIVSDYNRATFQREMHIASLVRHPNLLLFLGAVTTGNLQIVTELMETTLRKVMENGRLTPKGISPIAKHVACALNYLHSRSDPIIHRDVSSANVLLSSRQEGWVAKLGDFGSANFLNRTNTKIPGAQLYSAPEAIDSSVGPQGPKMDTYSFGVLLLEMCVCRLPETAVLRGAASDVPQWPQPKRLIGELALQCIIQDPDQRPYMAAVVNQL